ncbi:IQ domain-containing protein K [Megalops cyprinoides]|uniref:IQ domain-containing protein K n=1 Tax=Megalops cyprinoides TaxID=118141 RepID=UPI001864A513|nr:IQ domain-containing protein K [Megalops cyprinoides]
MARVIGNKKSLWQQICEEHESEQPRPPGDDWTDCSSVSTRVSQYSASKHTPVFYGLMTAKMTVDDNPLRDVDPLLCHPALAGYAVLEKPASSRHRRSHCRPFSPTPPLHTSSVTQFLEKKVFPVLLPGLEAMLREAQGHKCLERRRTRFNPCDFLTEWLYNQNPRRVGQQPAVDFEEIPFVQDWLSKHPRPPIPLSLMLSDEEAAVLIQSFWRGYKVRARADVQELRQWQRELREESRDITRTVQEFWARQESRVGQEMEDLDEPTQPNSSGVSILVLSPTPQSTIVLSPTAQLTAESLEALTPSAQGVDPLGHTLHSTESLPLPDENLAAISPSLQSAAILSRNAAPGTGSV